MESEIYIAGIGTCLGSKRVSVDEILDSWTEEDLYDINTHHIMDRKSVKKRAGTEVLARFSETESLEGCASLAINRAVSNSGFCLGDINGIYFSTASATALRTMPTPETIIARNLGLENILAVPIGSGCVGAMFALRDAYLQLREDSRNQEESVYVIGAGDRCSLVIDKKSEILFGEGCAAIVLTNRPVGNGYSIERVFLRSLIGANELGVLAMEIDNQTRQYKMDGGAVFSFVTYHALPRIRTGLGLDGLKDFYVIPHQASGKILKTVSSALDIDKSRVYIEDAAEIGNLTVASWPVAFYNAIRKGYTKDRTVVPIAFGAGNNCGGFVARPSGDSLQIIGKEN